MTKVFEFTDGSPHDKSARLDTRTGKLGGWTREDFVYTINVHQRAFGANHTCRALMTLFGTADPSTVPSYAFGTVIAALASEMAAGLPHNIPLAPRAELYGATSRAAIPFGRKPRDDA